VIYLEKLTEKKRKWIINQFRSGRSATIIAKSQNISRQYVYTLISKFKQKGVSAFSCEKAGRPKLNINSDFVKKVINIRQDDDYGSEKIHIILKKQGFDVSQHIIQRILDEQGLTEPCVKRRGRRNYVRYQWPVSNWMWHCDWSFYKGKWYVAYIDDRSRRIMGAGVFNEATTEHTLFVLRQAILENEVCPVIILSDKGSQFYANKKTKQGTRGLSKFEEELSNLGIDLWTSKRNHPQTNGKMEKWFDTLKKRFEKHPEETLKNVVNWYNKHRIHHALNYATPEETYQENL
jgi:putative transposase